MAGSIFRVSTKIGAGHRPIAIIPHGVFRHEFRKGKPLGWFSGRKCDARTDSDNGPKLIGESLAGGRKLLPGQVHLQVNRPRAARSGLIIEPAVAGHNEIVTVGLVLWLSYHSSGMVTRSAERAYAR